MKLRSPIVSLLIVCVVVGCSGSRDAAQGSTGTKEASGSDPGVSSSGGVSGTTTDPGSTLKVDPNLPTSDPAKSIMKQPPPVGADGWRASKADPKAFAMRVAKSVQSMSGVTGESLAVMKTPEASGSVRSLFRVRDAKNYRVDYIVERNRPTTGMIRADGKKRTVPLPDGLSKYVTYGTRSTDAKLSSKELVSKWPSEFTRLMWRGLTDGSDSWVPVIEGLMRGDGGFKTTFEERVRDFNGKKLTNYRLRATRTAQAAKTLGPCELEMVFDERFGLPVTIRVVRKDPKGKEWQTQWSAGYNFGQKLEATEFEIK